MVVFTPATRTILGSTALVVASGASAPIRAAAQAAKAKYGDLIGICDGTADNVEIQAAIDALPATGGKVVLSEGLFNLAASAVLRSAVTLEGAGWGALTDPATDDGITVLKTTGAVALISAVNANHFRIANLKTVGGAPAISITSSVGFGITRNFQMENIAVNGATGGGILIAGGSSNDFISSWHLNNITIRRVTGIGLEVANVSDAQGVNVYSFATSSHCIQMREGSAVRFTNIRGDNAGPSGAGDARCMYFINMNELTLVNFACLNATAEGLRSDTAGTDQKFIGGWCRHNGTNASLAATRRAGMVISSAVSDVTIMGAHFYDREAVPTQQYGMLDIAATHKVIGCTFLGNVTAPMRTVTAGATLIGNSPASLNVSPVADPGNAGAIAVTHSGNAALVTAGAETRTLAAPTFIGQELTLYFKTDGGDCVVTCATTLNEAGNNTLTFTATGQACQLYAVEEGSNLRWRLASADGATLSTV